jgi:hypothetical protein
MNSGTMFRISLTAVLATLVAAGCDSGPRAKPDGIEVKGRVLLSSGSPLTGGTIVLRPADGIHGASAQVQNDGSFQLLDPSGNKSVVPGKYQVYVLFNNPDHKTLREKVNPRYQSTEDGDSDIVVHIQPGQNDLVIRLNR